MSMISVSGARKKTARSFLGKEPTPPATPPMMPSSHSTALRRKHSIGLFDMDATESRIRRLSNLTQKNKNNPMCKPQSPRTPDGAGNFTRVFTRDCNFV